MQSAAIVILNYNGAEMLSRFLPTVIAFSSFPIVIIDNGSTDESLDLLKREFPQIKLIQLKSNFGFTGGYNHGLEILKGNFENYILLNSDIQVEQGWDVKLIRFLQENDSTAAVQPKILSFPHPGFFDYAGAGGGFLDSLGYPYCRGRIFNTIEKDINQYDETVEVDWASGACMSIRSQIFHGAGGFDERFFAHMEEIDLCWRIRKMGHAVHYLGTSKVWHVGGGTLDRTNPWKTFLNFRNNLLMLYNNERPSRFALIYLIRLGLDLLAAVVFLVRGSLEDAKAVVKGHVEFHRMKSKSPANLQVENIKPKGNRKFRKSILWDYYIRGKKNFSEL